MSADKETIAWLQEMGEKSGYGDLTESINLLNPTYLSVARYGNISGLEWLLEQNKMPETNMMVEACILPELETIQWLIQQGMGLGYAVPYLIEYGHLAEAQSILQGFVLPVDKLEFSIRNAAESQNIEALTWLLDYAAEQRVPDAQLELSDALWGSLQARYPDAQIAELLLEHGASANYQATGTTCLQQAIQRECPEIVRLLLEHGADPNVYVNPMEGGPLLHEAVRKGNLEIVRLLTEYGADLEKTYTYSQDEEPITAVEMAANYPSYHIRDYLAGRAEN